MTRAKRASKRLHLESTEDISMATSVTSVFVSRDMRGTEVNLQGIVQDEVELKDSRNLVILGEYLACDRLKVWCCQLWQAVGAKDPQYLLSRTLSVRLISDFRESASLNNRFILPRLILLDIPLKIGMMRYQKAAVLLSVASIYWSNMTGIFP